MKGIFNVRGTKITAIQGLWLVAIVALLFLGCQKVTQIVTGPSVDDHSGNGNTPSPSPEPTGAITSVRLSLFGDETCASGASPATEPNTIRVGCVQGLTITPLLADGSNAPEVIHGPAPDSVAVVSGTQALQLNAVSEPFNRDAVGLAAGTAKVRAVVKGVTGELDVTVVN